MSSSPSQKRPKLQDEGILSQSDVSWRDNKIKDNFASNNADCSSPTISSPRAIGGARNIHSSNQLVQTPVRIMKRHVSSPVLSAKPSTKFERKSHSTENRGFFTFNRTAEENNDKNELSEEELKFNYDDLSAYVNVDKKEVLKENQRAEPSSSSVSLLRATESFNLDDSFDDAIFNAIPLEALTKFNTTKSVPLVLPSQTTTINTQRPSKQFERHNSMPTFIQKRPPERKLYQMLLICSQSHLFYSLLNQSNDGARQKRSRRSDE